MKVGIDARAAIWYRGTGIGTYTYQLLKSLHAHNNRQFNYRFFWPGDEYRDLDITQDEIFYKIDQRKDKFWEEVHIPAKVSEEGISLYHVPQNGIGLPAEKNCKFVVTVHDLIPYVYPETVGKGYLRLFLQHMPRIIEESDKIITVSECSKQDIIRLFRVSADKIEVTYEAPEPIYKPLDQQVCRQFLAEKYNITRPFVLYLGGFSPRKNVKGLLIAFREIYKDLNGDCELVIVGKQAREFDELQLLTEALDMEDVVRFAGFAPVEELPYFYNACNLFVYPSLYEGFGLPPLEAMACGAPVITTSVSSMPEVVGDAAILVNPYDNLELADSMFSLLSNDCLRQAYGLRGLAKAQEYSWDKMAKETIDIYQKILSE